MKIIVLAGGSDQIALIQELKLRGHEVVLVDYFQNPPAKSYADKHIVASTLDVEAVRDITLSEQADLICTACTDQALLTMAGPVGWVIGGTSALGGILLQAITNHELAKKAEKATKTILKEAERIKEINATVCAWNKETIRLCNELEKQITTIRRKKDYNLFSAEDKYTLISVMNMTELLSKKLGETVS